MEKQNVRVLLASEYPEVRNFLQEVIEKEPGNVIVGQADNATKALTLARNLRPDVAIIDSNLPYTIGLDAIPLSRISGLDTAQTTSAEIPNMRVVLLNNLDVLSLPEYTLSPDFIARFSRETMETSVPFTLQELFLGTETPGTLIFANVETKPRAALARNATSLSDKAIFFGVLGTIGGLFLIATMLLSQFGAVMAAAGAVAIFLGVASKLISKLLKPGSNKAD